MAPADALSYGLAALAWAALCYRAPALVRGRRAGTRRALWTTLVAVALALTVRLPPVGGALDRLAGVPNLAQLVENGLILVAIWGVYDFPAHLHGAGDSGAAPVVAPAIRRVHSWLLGLSLAAMTALFALAPVHEPADDFWVRYADAPLMPAYRLVYLAYLGAGLVTLVRLCVRYSGLTARATVALGLRLCAAGGALGMVYLVHEAGYMALRGAGAPYPLEGVVGPGRVRNALIAAALVPLLVGSTLPAWGERVGAGAALTAAWRWLDGYRAYRRLYPLWRDLVRAAPEVALLRPPGSRPDVPLGRVLRLRLYRRVIEIWDGRLAVRPYCDARVVGAARRACHAAGVALDEEPFVVEAAALAAGMRARAHGRAAATPAPLPLDDRPSPEAAGRAGVAGATLDHDAAVLGRVARCYADSPVVKSVLAAEARFVYPTGAAARPPAHPGAGRP